MTTPAQGHREKIEAAKAAQAAETARKAVPPPPAKAAKKRPPVSEIPVVPATAAHPAGDVSRAVTLAKIRSPAAMRRLRIEAARSASARAANDNGAETAPAPETGPEGLIRLQLTEDKRRLKALESIEAKIALKATLLPTYADWCAAVVAAGAGAAGQAVQDDVVATIFMWRIDAGDYAGALELADHLLRHKLALPLPNLRSVATFLAEEVAEAAIKAAQAGKPFPADVLGDVHVLTDDRDMVDQVRAKLFKADGLVALSIAEAAIADGENEAAMRAVAGLKSAALDTAKTALARAKQLEPKIGVTKLIEQVDRLIAAEAKAAADNDKDKSKD